jgi:hypothetical protein
MWSGFDPQLRREWAIIKQMVAHQRQTPVREWPLVFMEEQGQLLVVREWPDGAITSYTMSREENAPGR